MNSTKYTRLPNVEPERADIKFDALDGPSFFTYDNQQNKYKSAFTYNTPFGSKKTEQGKEESQQSTLFRICAALATVICYFCFIITLPVSFWWSLKLAKSFERIIIYRLGRLQTPAGPGYVIVLPCIDRWSRVDLRMKAFSVPPQKVITADGAVIEIGAEIFYRVKDPVLSVGNVQDLNHSTRIICQTSLQKHVGKQHLGDLDSNRVTITDALQGDVNQMTQSWGVEVSKIELSSVKLFSQPNSLFSQSSNPLSVLGSVLFPPGSSNPPMEQFQQFFGGGSIPEKPALPWDAQSQNVNNNSALAHEKKSNPLVVLQNLIESVKAHLSYTMVKEFGLVYKFVLTADNDEGNNGIFYLDLKNGEGQIGMGYPFLTDPDVTLTLTVETLQDLLAERVSPFNAYMGGQLAVAGDLRAAMKLGSFIETVFKK